LPLLLLVGHAGAQTWQALPATSHPPISGFVAMAHDPLRRRTVCIADEVLFAGPGWAQGRTSTWEWDGSRWLSVRPTTQPSPQGAAHTACYDPLLRRVVLVNAAGQTWSYDGIDWERNALTAPPLADPSLALDRTRGTLVLVDGGVIREPQGGSWTVRAQFPTALGGARIGFDPIGNRMIAFGGFDGTYPGTTWSWDGATLTPLATPTSPTGRVDHQLVTDDTAGRLLLLGGADEILQQRVDTVLAWDGAAWLAQPNLPTPRAGFAAAHDGVALLVYGGSLGSNFASTDESAELSRSVAGGFVTVPLPTAGLHSAHDPLRNRTVSPVDGRTLEFDGTAWSDRSIPAPQAVTALAFHTATASLIACTSNGATWRFDGSVWAPAVTPFAPPPRDGAAFAYDPSRQRLVLFGGSDSQGPRNDVWEWDGSAWSNPSSVNPPPAGPAAFGWDPLASRLVLVREATAPTSAYTWNGASWSTIGPLPGLHRNRRLATHPQFGLLMLANQPPQGPEFGEIALLTGNTWNWLPTTLPEKASRGRLSFDTNRGELMLHDSRQRRSWTLTLQPAVVDTSGGGCGGSAGVPLLRAANQPQLGESVVSDVFSAAPGSACFVLIDIMPAAVPLPGGCTQGLAAPVLLAAAVTSAGGHASAAFAIPTVTSLRGLSLFAQALTIDPNGALLGFASLTNTLRLQIGD
jgi:hypothetical protein